MATSVKKLDQNKVRKSFTQNVSFKSCINSYEILKVIESSEMTLQISNLDLSITKEIIEEMCIDLIGPEFPKENTEQLVESIRFPLNPETKKSRGFCYITFQKSEYVTKALYILTGVPLLGRITRASRFNEDYDY